MGSYSRKIVESKINELIQAEIKGNTILLLRGENKNKLREKLIGKLNSNDSLYDGLFLVGDKAKNYLVKESNIPHSIKRITDIGKDTADWIFEEFSKVDEGVIDLEYFRNKNNKIDFISKLENNQELIDYYLFGLHTFNSELLVNFVSTTKTPQVAFSHNSDLIIISWLINEHEHLCVSKNRLIAMREEVLQLSIPVLNDSFHPNENEYAIKGFIPSHYIWGVIDVKDNLIVLNPEVLNTKSDWLTDGFDIDELTFEEFIKTTKYKRYLMLMDGKRLEEKDI